MTGDPDERNSIASYRQIFANSAGFIVQSLAVPMVTFFGRGNDAQGYQFTMGLLSVLSVIFFIIAFFATKERIQPDPQQKSSLGQDLSDLFEKRPWVVLFLATTVLFHGDRDARQRHAALLHDMSQATPASSPGSTALVSLRCSLALPVSTAVPGAWASASSSSRA